MTRPSLRTAFLGGTVAIVALVVAGYAGVVYLRARAAAESALHDALRVRAGTLAGVLRIEGDVVELDLPPGERPEYFRPGSGAYFILYAPDGREAARSGSLGTESLPRPTIAPGALVEFRRCDAGPFGAPCEIAETRYGVSIEGSEDDDDDDEDGDEASGSGAFAGVGRDSEFVMQMALDRRETDRSLAALATFLAVAGLLGVGAALGGAAALSHLLLAPIRRMTDAARAMTPEEPERRLAPATVVRELHSLATTLNDAFDDLTDALRRQERLTTDASHELRTPVAVLLSNAELLLRRERSAEDYRAGLARQVRVAKRLSLIVSDLLFLARAESGRERFERRPVDLGRVAESACDEWQAMAARRGVSLVLGGRSGVVVAGDAARLSQLADNLLSNSLKVTPRGGRVGIAADVEDGTAVLRVSDTGPGIAPEHQARLFERFYRVDERPRDPDGESSGSGLGLSIVERIARAHGGAVSVESRVGEGATFTLRLPPAPAAIAAVTEDAGTSV